MQFDGFPHDALVMAEMNRVDKEPTLHPVWRRYGVAAGLVVVACFLGVALRPWLGFSPLAPFYGAVALAAWYGGLGPALLATGLCLIGIDLFTVEPLGQWSLDPAHLSQFVSFLAVSALLVGLSASRDRADAALHASERRFRTMLETANEGVWLVDREARTQYANDRMAALLGTTPERVMAGTVGDFVFPEDQPLMRERVGANLAGWPEEFDFRFRRADGDEVLVLAGTSPMRDGAGRIAGALGLFTDVTARRRVETALVHANERFALAADAVQALIYEWDLRTDRVERSSGLWPLVGFRPDEVPADQVWWRSRIHPDDLGRIAVDPGGHPEEQDRYSREYRVQHRDGHWVTVWDQGQIVRDRDGRIVRVVGSTIDVTSWKDAENALRVLSEAGRALASSLDYEVTLQQVASLAVPTLADWCVVDLLDDQGVLRRVAVAHAAPEHRELANTLLANAQTVPLSGREDEVITTWRSLLITPFSDGDIQAAAQGAEHRDVLQALGIVSAIAVPVRAGGQAHGVLTLIMTSASNRQLDADDLAVADQLARRAAVAIENARLVRDAQTAETRYRGLFEGARDGIIVFAPDGQCVDVNPAMASMVGYGRAELVGAPATLVACGGPWSGEEGDRLRRDGQWRGDFELRHRNGSLMPVESAITTVRLPTGPVYVGVLRDVSDRKRFEQLQEEFLSALAHDLKNPLTTVRGQTQLLLRRLGRNDPPDAERLESALEGIDTAARRMSRLLDEMTDVTRLRAGQEIDLQREDTDLVALARRTVDEHDRVTEPHTIRLIAETDELIGFWDGPRLERVLGNLLGNAIKYSPEGGEITVRIAREVAAAGDSALLSVEDRGVGIPEADRELIFERFRRAANVERFAGSGIGLAGAKRIVELHGGTINVTSTEGEGSTFTVRLPVTREDD